MSDVLLVAVFTRSYRNISNTSPGSLTSNQHTTNERNKTHSYSITVGLIGVSGYQSGGHRNSQNTKIGFLIMLNTFRGEKRCCTPKSRCKLLCFFFLEIDDTILHQISFYLKDYRAPRYRGRCVTIVLVERRCTGCKNK